MYFAECIQPSWYKLSTYVRLLQNCIARKALLEGKQVHSHINQNLWGFTPETLIVLKNTLINMYDKCGSLVDARRVFDHISQPDVCSWNMIIAAYRRHGLPQQAFTLFHQMQRTVQPNQFTFSCILPVCASVASLKHGLQIHAKIIRCSQPDVIVISTLIDMYAKCGSIQNARELFDNMPHRDVVSWNSIIAGYVQNGFLNEGLRLFKDMPQQNVVSWTSIIAGYAQNGHVEKTFEIFKQMQFAGVKPNSSTFASILPACAQLGALEQGMEIHKSMVESGLVSDVVVVTALIDMYAKCRKMLKACHLFDKMAERNEVSWNTMITGYAQNGILDEAVRVFKEMPQPTVVSWTAIVAGYAQNGLAEKGLDFFKQMQLTNLKLDSSAFASVLPACAKLGTLAQGVNPGISTFASILPACAKLGTLEQGMEIHQIIIKCGFLSEVVSTALTHMYAKCGSIQKAHKLFDNMHHPDAIAWNAMIAGYAINGYSEDSLRKFELMRQSGINPSPVSFVCVLFACSHAGLLDDGCKYFNSMSNSYCVIPIMDHYACMVDLLGRAGHLEDALNFIIKMPIKPDVVVWMCFLGACRSHKNIELGEFVGTLLFELDPKHSQPYVLLSNIYAELGRWSDIQKVRKLLKVKGIRKIPGCSWIEVHKIIHAFHVGDRSHPQTQEIYAELEKLLWKMKAVGYIADTRPVLNDVEEEEKELLLSHHSEKLAIAFGLLNTSPATTIRVVKNLREAYRALDVNGRGGARRMGNSNGEVY
ncbi:pentatricopeptide repeat-containing protein At1g56690, mitochondrial [Cryptomeria japonica]|uniref:pentatricopeptide repeat-containing protein At1g56690, mitochondrial n=1 Tax=Cryptomeria japonica TaxID=3369 RepID=UPI0027DA9E6A|nr:pentatricopeptide repeat-containing protein At1g56690, mitochondrial [Cryptomeria japonica]